jgi:8-oxo-dGTP pyrophosphatase MutT (NUDIX family)
MILQVGVKVLLKNPEGKILILRRSDKYGDIADDKWDIVGGRIDTGTTLLENLKREVQEEAGLAITSVPKLIAAQDILRSEEKHVVRLTYVAHTEGDPKLDGEEHTTYKWVSFEELATEPRLDSYVLELIKNKALVADSWA